MDAQSATPKTPERYALVKRGATWKRTLFDNLVVGDTFTLFEPDGKPAHDGKVFVMEERLHDRSLIVRHYSPTLVSRILQWLKRRSP